MSEEAAIRPRRWVGTTVAAVILGRHRNTVLLWRIDGLIPPAHWRQVGKRRKVEYDANFLHELALSAHSAQSAQDSPEEVA